MAEWLRPIIDNKPWDYCVFWKLGDDPSRFIEWGSCCCSGGVIKVKDENGADNGLIDECKDKLIKHSVTTQACKKLAQLPSVIPLYSGIHGDVVISKRPRWTKTTQLNSDDDEPNGTQVLIPVASGLIEIFSTKHVPKDAKIIDYIVASFNHLSLKQENMSENVQTNDYCLDRLTSSIHYFNLLPHVISQPNNYSSFEGSSTCSSLSTEHQLLKLDSAHPKMSPQNPTRVYAASSSRNPRLKRKKYIDHSAHGYAKEGVKISQESGVYKSKNLMTERNRRKRIKDGMFALRSLVPKITKMDRAATLGDAADYIEELVETIENYRDELRAMDDESCAKVNAKQNPRKKIRDSSDNKFGANEKTQIKAEVEVSQVGANDFLVKLVCKQRQGGFSRFMEAMVCLGLQVTDANVTTFNGSVLNVLKVEGNGTVVEPHSLKHSLLQLIN